MAPYDDQTVHARKEKEEEMDESLAKNAVHDVKEDVGEAARGDRNTGEELGWIERQSVQSRRIAGVSGIWRVA